MKINPQTDYAIELTAENDFERIWIKEFAKLIVDMNSEKDLELIEGLIEFDYHKAAFPTGILELVKDNIIESEYSSTGIDSITFRAYPNS